MKKRLTSCLVVFAMILSAICLPAYADNSAADQNEYKVLYDLAKDGITNTTVFTSDGKDTITIAPGWSNDLLKSNPLQTPVTSGVVRYHMEYMHQYSWRKPAFKVVVENGDGSFPASGTRCLGFAEEMTSADVFELGYYGGCENWTFTKGSSDISFEKGVWYQLDTIYDLTNGRAYYYVDGKKIGESAGPNKIAALGFYLNRSNISGGNGNANSTDYSYIKNAKLDTGFKAEVTDKSADKITVEFTQPVSLDADAVTVKCLEDGTTPTVKVTKVNDMKYDIEYKTSTANIGGDFTLTFSDAFAEAYGMSEKQ